MFLLLRLRLLWFLKVLQLLQRQLRNPALLQ
jgi:hypothetical protein